MKAKLSDLLTPEEQKLLKLYNIYEGLKIEDLTVKILSNLFSVLKDFEERPTGYIIPSVAIEILVNRAVEKNIPLF